MSNTKFCACEGTTDALPSVPVLTDAAMFESTKDGEEGFECRYCGEFYSKASLKS